MAAKFTNEARFLKGAALWLEIRLAQVQGWRYDGTIDRDPVWTMIGELDAIVMMKEALEDANTQTVRQRRNALDL